MSQENVEVVRRFIEALPGAQASDDWQPVLAEVDPDVEIDDLDISLDTERYRGHHSVRKWIGVWMETVFLLTRDHLLEVDHWFLILADVAIWQ